MSTAYDSFLRSVAGLAEIDWRKFRRRSARHHLDSRLGQLGLPDYGEYLEYLRRDRNEVQRLPDLMRVTVSRFFRESVCWRELSEEVLPALLASMPAGKPLRAWSAGCCNGEEPYTLAMCFETLGSQVHPEKVSGASRIEILATDIDDDVLARAHEGCYQKSSLREIPPELISRFFDLDPQGRGLCLDERAKARVDFQRRNLMEDLPPTGMDLVLCRYLAFTYYRGARRARAAAKLHDSLNPGGALMIGCKERLLPTETGLFEPWPRTRAILRRKP